MRSGFVIDSLPRTGSTTLAKLLDCHPDINCLIEPFHPQRYGGQYHDMAVQMGSVMPALNLIWHRWNGIKHVWLPGEALPFRHNPEFNNEIVCNANRVISLQRRNLLRRHLSSAISRQMKFWIGTRKEFLARLDKVQLPTLDPSRVRIELEQTLEALRDRDRLLKERGNDVLRISYEEIFDEQLSKEARVGLLNRIFEFLGFRQLGPNDFVSEEWDRLFDKDIYKWSSFEIYKMLPNIDDLQRELSCDDYGSIF